MLKLLRRSDDGIFVHVRAGTSHTRPAAVGGGTRAALDDGEPTLPVAAVARRLGVAPATLRTWDRRYGLGPSGHTGGKHRRYSPVDVTRLEVMQRALLSGASTAEAARYALDTVPDAPDVVVVPAQHVPAGAPTRDEVELSRLARELSTAALAMDVTRIRQVIGDAVDAEGALAAWHDVIEPVLDALRGGWSGPRPGSEVAQLLSDLALARLTQEPVPRRRALRGSPVLLAADDPHLLPGLHAAAAELAARGLDAVVTSSAGAGVLVELARGVAPAAVVLAVTDSSSAELFTELRRGRRHVRFFACGRAINDGTAPSTVECVPDMVSVVERVSFVLLGEATP